MCTNNEQNEMYEQANKIRRKMQTKILKQMRFCLKTKPNANNLEQSSAILKIMQMMVFVYLLYVYPVLYSVLAQSLSFIRLRYQSHNVLLFQKKQTHTNCSRAEKMKLQAKLKINLFCHCAHLFTHIKVGIYLFVW